MLASRTVFTRDIFTTIRIRILSDFDLVGFGIIFPDFKPTYRSARCSPAGKVFTRDILTTIWIRIRSNLGLVGSGIIFPESVFLSIPVLLKRLQIRALIRNLLISQDARQQDSLYPGIYSPQSGSGSGRILTWSDSE
jgi:hypothetical protein